MADLYRLISSSYEAISFSTPHLYISALAWLPEKSPLRPVISCMTSDSLIATGRNKIWSPMLWTYTVGGDVRAIGFSPENKFIAACSTEGDIFLFDANTGVLETRLRNHGVAVCSISFSPDGKRLASGSADGSVATWDLRAGEVVAEPLTGHSHVVTSIAYSPDGHFIASYSLDGEIRIWDAQSGVTVRVIGCYTSFEICRLAYSHDVTKITYYGVEGIIVRDTQSGKILNKLSSVGNVFWHYVLSGRQITGIRRFRWEGLFSSRKGCRNSRCNCRAQGSFWPRVFHKLFLGWECIALCIERRKDHLLGCGITSNR